MRRYDLVVKLSMSAMDWDVFAGSFVSVMDNPFFFSWVVDIGRLSEIFVGSAFVKFHDIGLLHLAPGPLTSFFGSGPR